VGDFRSGALITERFIRLSRAQNVATRELRTALGDPRGICIKRIKGGLINERKEKEPLVLRDAGNDLVQTRFKAWAEQGKDGARKENWRWRRKERKSEN